MIRGSSPYTSGWGSFVLLKMDCVRLAWGGSLSTLHRNWKRLDCSPFLKNLSNLMNWTK